MCPAGGFSGFLSLATSFLSGLLDQMAPPPGGERQRTPPCGGYGEAAGAGVSGPNCPKKEKALFSKFLEKQNELPQFVRTAEKSP